VNRTWYALDWLDAFPYTSYDPDDYTSQDRPVGVGTAPELTPDDDSRYVRLAAYQGDGHLGSMLYAWFTVTGAPSANDWVLEEAKLTIRARGQSPPYDIAFFTIDGSIAIGFGQSASTSYWAKGSLHGSSANVPANTWGNFVYYLPTSGPLFGPRAPYWNEWSTLDICIWWPGVTEEVSPVISDISWIRLDVTFTDPTP
jgi:hypothetical protein